MRPVESAVIAAAGLGSRLGLGVPKCLLEVEGRTVLSRLVEAVEPRVSRVHVVVGYREDLIIDFCARNHPRVVLVRNPSYRTTNTAHSFALGARALTGKCVFLDGDLLAVPESLGRFLEEAAAVDLLIGLTEAKSENAVYVECDGEPTARGGCVVKGFTRERRGATEWANVVAGPSRLLDGAPGYVFERLEEHLPARGAEIELCEIDTGSDYESAKGFVRSRHL